MHLNAYMGYIYRPIATKVGMWVCLGGMYYMSELVFRIFYLYDF